MKLLSKICNIIICRKVNVVSKLSTLFQQEICQNLGFQKISGKNKEEGVCLNTLITIK